MDIIAKGISKRYFRKAGDRNYFYAVQETDVELRAGELTVLTGRSGSGKTTLMSLLAGLLRPDTGEVLADGRDLYQMGDKALSAFRTAHIGVMPQGRAALDTMTVLENTLLTARFAGKQTPELIAQAEALLGRFGIADLRDARPRELSGGELRRMMLARALLTAPEVLMCDEPTGDLDDANTALVLDALRAYAREGRAVLLVTHEADAARYADRMLTMDAGKVTGTTASQQ